MQLCLFSSIRNRPNACQTITSVGRLRRSRSSLPLPDFVALHQVSEEICVRAMIRTIARKSPIQVQAARGPIHAGTFSKPGSLIHAPSTLVTAHRLAGHSSNSWNFSTAPINPMTKPRVSISMAATLDYLGLSQLAYTAPSSDSRARVWPCCSQFFPSNGFTVIFAMVVVSRHLTFTLYPSGLDRGM